MAEIYRVRGESDPERCLPWIENVDLAQCVDSLGVQPMDYFGHELPREPYSRLVAFRGYEKVFVRVDVVEALSFGWRPGFYECRLDAKTAKELLEAAGLVVPTPVVIM